MPGEHELQIALATALRERDEALSREAGLARANKSLADDLIDKCHALAAARRECEGLRTMLDRCRVELQHPEFPHTELLGVLEAALAAPAAGEEGKHGS